LASPVRPFAALRTADQWRRCAHAATLVDDEHGGVQLGWRHDAGSVQGPPRPAGGLAFDARCRLYRSISREGGAPGRVERTLVPLGPVPGTAQDLFVPAPAARFGDFTAPDAAAAALAAPGALAVDGGDRLYLIDGVGRILIIDLYDERLVRTLTFPAPARDVRTHDDQVVVLLAAAPYLMRIGVTRELRAIAVPAPPVAPGRIAVGPGGVVVILDRPGTAEAQLRYPDGPIAGGAVPFAGDLIFDAEGILVVAARPGEDLRRFHLESGNAVERPPLRARRYDGRGIALAPDGRITYWAGTGLGFAVAARLIFEPAGRVVSYRLDSGEAQNVWGRLELDACLPAGTDLRVAYLTADDPSDEPPLPGNPELLALVRAPAATPPLPPASLVPDAAAVVHRLHRRADGRELPWSPLRADDPFETYEAPIDAEPGRYLWVVLRLTGNTRATPRVRALRAEQRGHDHLRRLPRVFSRVPDDARFLSLFLALFDAITHDLEARAAERQALVSPGATPDELLPWLSSFVGLVLDERWPIPVRRAVIAQAIWLFRFRGTVCGLQRFLELCLERPVVILERFRLRGLGAAATGPGGAITTTGVLGAGFRVGAQFGSTSEAPLEGTFAAAFAASAHRFTVVLPGALSDDQRAVVEHILQQHRPAHTVYDLCTVDAGMRVGQGLHVGLTTIVGQSDGWRTLQVGQAVLGRDGILGRPATGGALGATRVGKDTRVG
jgi:phage tail-like protein